MHDPLLPPQAAALRMGIGLKKLRSLHLPHEGDYYKLYRASVCDEWVRANGTSRERRAEQARRQFSKYRRYVAADGSSMPASRHPHYYRWQKMIARCDGDDPNYGGRGIRVCDEWADDPVAFYEWVDDNPPAEGETLDRYDVDGDYEPSNSWFADAFEQNANRRSSRWYRATKCLCRDGECEGPEFCAERVMFRALSEYLTSDGLADFVRRACVASAARERDRAAAEQHLMAPFESAQLEMLLNGLEW